MNVKRIRGIRRAVDINATTKRTTYLNIANETRGHSSKKRAGYARGVSRSRRIVADIERIVARISLDLDNAEDRVEIASIGRRV